MDLEVEAAAGEGDDRGCGGWEGAQVGVEGSEGGVGRERWPLVRGGEGEEEGDQGGACGGEGRGALGLLSDAAKGAPFKHARHGV